MLLRLLRGFGRRRDGSVSIVAAISLPILISMTGMVAEYGNGLLHKVEDQRVADAAAFEAATAYNANSSNSLTSAADQVATMNGLTASNISAALVASPSGDGNNAVKVIVSTTQPLLLSKIMSGTLTSLPVTATSYAELQGGAPGCIIALSTSGTGVTLNGGTSVTANACAVASDATVKTPCGTSITTIAVDYETTGGVTECTTPDSINPPTGKSLNINKSSTSDPIAGTTELTAATTRLATGTFYTGPGSSTTASTAGVGGLAAPAAPSVTTGSETTQPGYTGTGMTGLPTGCVDTGYVAYSSTHNIVCTGNGPFDFGTVIVGGGITFTVTTVSATAPVFNMITINFSGTAMSWPAGTYNVTQGIQSSGGGASYFGAGTYNIGGGTFSCNGSTGYSICDTSSGTMSFGGSQTQSPGSVVMTTQGGVTDTGGATLVLGTGTTNSFDIGKAADGTSFAGTSGAIAVFGDATGTGDVFEMAGNFTETGGGSCVAISQATEHDINGEFISAGATLLGSGTYTIANYVSLGGGGGGDVGCTNSNFPSKGQPSTFGLYGDPVTLVIGGKSLTGATSGDAFYMGAGYSNVTLIAPTSGSLQNLAVVGPITGSAGAQITSGAYGTDISGAFYFPTAAITLDGGASLGSIGSTQCLMVIGSQVTVNAGAALGTTCSGIGSSGASTVALVE